MRYKRIAAACLLLGTAAMLWASLPMPVQAEESINFEGIITDSQGYNDYYINQNTWLIGDENTVKLPSYDGKDKDYLRFMESGKRSFFGPRLKYEDFVCRFTVIMNETDSPDGASLGLSFGRNQLYSMADECNGFVFMKASEGTAVRATQGNMDRAHVGSIWLQYREQDAVDLWETTDASYDVMVVKSGDRAYLYYAETGDEAAMKTLRATISGVSGEGYVAVCGLMGATFRLDEFSVVSLTEGVTDVSAFTYSGAAAPCGSQAVIGHGGTAAIPVGTESFSLSFRVQMASGDGLAVQLGENSVWLNADGSLTAAGMQQIEAGETTEWTSSARLRVRLQNGILWLEAAGESGYRLCGAFSFTGDVPEQIVLRAGADTTFIAEDVCLVSLQPKIVIEKHDYDPVTDIDPIHEKELSFDEYYGGKK